MRLAAALIVGCAFVVSACDTKPITALTYAERVELLKELEANCKAAGVTNKSPKFEACMDAEIEAEVEKRSANRKALEEFAEGLDQAGKNYTAASSRTVTCNSYSYNRYSTTTRCY